MKYHSILPVRVGIAMLLCLSLVPGCGRGGKKPGIVVQGQGVAIEVPADIAKQVTGKAVPPDVLELMSRINKKAPPLAAAEFEPSGTVVPDGAKVTWQLPQKQPAASELWVVFYDPIMRKWYGTGEKAKVDPSGTRATGTIYHFSPPVGVSAAEPEEFGPSGQPVPVDPNGRFTAEKSQDNKRIFTTAGVTVYQPAIIDKAKRQAGIRAYDEIVRAKGPDGALDFNDFKKLTQSTEYATVKSLIEDGTIGRNHNYQLGDWRIFALVDNLKAVLKDMKGVKVYRSDTGNQKNAYLSDVDQTIFAYKQNESGEWVRWPEGDVIIKDRLMARLKEQGIPAAKMEVETMPGRDRFIDERLVGADLEHLLPGELSGKPREVIISYTNVGLGTQGGAYFLAGTVKQLMQMRVADQASRHLQGTIYADPRPIMVPEVKELMGRLNGQACTEIGPTKPGSDDVGVREGSYEDARRVLMDGLEPALQRGWAYDAAVDSHIKYNEKLKYTLDPHKPPPVKHVLRCVDYGMGMLARVDGRTNHAEYATRNDAQRMEYLKSAFGADLAQPRTNRWDIRDGTSFLDRWKEALDICAELRNVTDKEVRPVMQADLDNAFRKLAEKMAGPGNEARWQEFLGQARQEYNQRCQEILTHSMVAASKERVMGWLTPDPENPTNREEMNRHIDEDEIRRALRLTGPEHDARWASIRKEIFTNFADTARVQLMYSFRYMKPEMVELIIRQAESNPKLSRADVVKIRELARTAKHPLFHVLQYPKFPKLYHQIIREWVKFNAEAIGKRVTEHLLLEIGYIDTSAARREPNPMFQKVGLDGADAAVHEFFKKYNKTAGFGMRFVKNTVMNPGNVAGVAEVLREWSESKGDPDVIEDAIIRETINAMPVIGQVVSFANCRNFKEFGMTGALMAAAMYTPVAGHVMLLFSLGEAGVAIYQSDYRAPMSHAVADTLYRGFVGPSLFNFGGTPAQFTDGNKSELSQVQSDLRTMKWTFASKEEMTGLLLRERQLLDKKEKWNGYVIEQSRYEGGTLSGTAAQLRQKPLELAGDPEFPDEPKWMGGPMLARVTPIVLFTSSREGPVDFDAKPLTDAERSKMDSLKQQSETENNSPKQFQIAAEIEKLAGRQEAYDRAQRYLARAKQVPELMHQIRLDSLWPYILRDMSHDMVSASRFVDEWIALRRAKVVDALGKLGVQTDYQAIRDAKEELAARLLEDTQRSKERWTQYENFKKGREKADEQFSEGAQVRSHAEALMMWVEDKTNNFSPAVNGAFAEAGLDPAYTAGLEYLGEAVMNRHRPISTPELRITGTVIKGDPDAKKEADKQDRLRPSVKVIADPDVFVQPWSYSVHQLNRDAVKAAVSSRKYQGLPVDDKMVETLQKYLKAYPEPKDAKEKKADKAPPAFLVYAFCADFKMPDRVVPQTAANVPRLVKYAVPGAKEQAYLLGGGALWAELTPAESGPLKVVVRRAPNGMGNTELIVTSDAVRIIDRPDADKTFPYAKFTLQVAPEKDGPWTTVKEFPLSQYDRPIKPIRPNSQEDLRIAADQVLLVDNFLSWHFEEKKIPVGPLWFRVGQKSYLHLKEPKEEVLSDPVPPSTSATIHLNGSGMGGWNDWMATDRREIAVGPGPNPSIEVGLGVDNQSFLCPGAHLVLKESGRTFHYYTPRSEGPVQFGGMGNGYSRAMITMTLPEKPAQIEMSAEWRNYQATREFTVTAHDRPDALKHRQDWPDTRRREMDDAKSRAASNSRDCPASIARSQQRLAERVTDPPKNYGENERYLDAELNIIRCEYEMRMDREYRVPSATMRYEQERAWQAREWPALAKAVRAELDAAKRAREIEIEKLKREKAAKQKAYAMPGAPANAQQDLAYIDRLIADAKNMYFIGTDELCTRVTQAGDAPLLRELYDLRIEQHKNTRKDTPQDTTYGTDLGRIYASYADQWAMLTGDREQAAQLYAESRRVYKQPLLRYGRELPVWWPEGKEGKVFQPAEKPKPATPADKSKDVPKEKAPPKPIPKVKAKGK